MIPISNCKMCMTSRKHAKRLHKFDNSTQDLLEKLDKFVKHG